MLYQSKLKYITRLSLACGVMITAVAFSGCSGSPKAVQANAAVVSSGVMSTEPNSGASGINSSESGITSSDLVSHAAPSVSSAVAVNGGAVSSQKPSSMLCQEVFGGRSILYAQSFSLERNGTTG